ncbi:MAG: hypothetical protein QHC78_05010 [Pigmentiphaga sp.]|uniref:hypothetical protein n=1 Tax=Pigmentiphaga sp. TaxID=1977564 RepID=UPI0029A2A350|nr:hypothetical protein [Pigmentiphaga sp.]MDX3905030.1 hypothetical protein [Pigmentiphaga sp.]
MPRRFDAPRAALGVALAGMLALAAGVARAEAAGPYIPAALAIPAVASRAEAFVPEGFSLEREVEGDLGGQGRGVAQVYRNAGGRRALLLGTRGPGGFEATGWGFVLPCATCGLDLPADRNLELEIRRQRVIVTDRSLSKADAISTSAQLILQYDGQSRRWWLQALRQLTVFTRTGRAEESRIDYETGDTRDAVGYYDGQVFFAESVQPGKLEGDPPTLDSLVLY